MNEDEELDIEMIHAQNQEHNPESPKHMSSIASH